MSRFARKIALARGKWLTYPTRNFATLGPFKLLRLIGEGWDLEIPTLHVAMQFGPSHRGDLHSPRPAYGL